MQCGKCGHGKTHVIDSREGTAKSPAAYVRRRRKCPECNARFTTYERRETTAGDAARKTGLSSGLKRRLLDEFLVSNLCTNEEARLLSLYLSVLRLKGTLEDVARREAIEFLGQTETLDA